LGLAAENAEMACRRRRWARPLWRAQPSLLFRDFVGPEDVGKTVT
jgi:hypothetical protein